MAKIIIAIIFTVIGIAGSLRLKMTGTIGEPSFDLFICAFLLVGLFVAFSDRVKSFSLRDLKLEMEKVEQARADVQEREQRVRKIAALLGDLITYVEATSISASDTKVGGEWLRLKLAAIGEITGKQVDNPFWQFSQKLATFDSGLIENDAKLTQAWADLEKNIEKDVAKLKSA